MIFLQLTKKNFFFIYLNGCDWLHIISINIIIRRNMVYTFFTNIFIKTKNLWLGQSRAVELEL